VSFASTKTVAREVPLEYDQANPGECKKIVS
jgi:hypothetical protein